MAQRLEFRVLGPLEVTTNGTQLDLGPHKQRSVLALLVANANQVVSVDRITDALWGDKGFDKEKTLWVYISRLRSALEPDRTSRGESSVLLTKQPGYLLAVDPDQVDYLRFEQAVTDARAAIETDPGRTETILDEALDLWDGEAFADLAYEAFLRNDADRLNDLRLEGSELRFDAMLRGGQAAELVTDLEVFVRENPYREKPVGQLMVSLYRSGRQAEALRVYERYRRTVADELGIDPSPDLDRIEEQILLHDPTLVPRSRTTTRLLAAQTQANPYKGLHAFNEADEGAFFGRDALVADLLRRIDHGDRLVAVVGPSGSGKSSVVRAGIIPRIRKTPAPNGDQWVVAQMVPGAHPFTELEAALLRARLEGPDSLGDQLRAGTEAILRAGLRILPDTGSRLLLVIDQFEELFTLVEDRAEQQRFLESLLVAIDDPHGRIRVVLTLRADFYDRPLLHPEFGRRLGDAVVNVTPLSAQELEDAAMRPAGVAGVAIEPRLLARLLADVVGEPGALPMFQYTLTELYERQLDGVLLESNYDKMGGLRGAITNRAEELYGELEPAEQAAAGQLFLRLVAMSDEETWSRRRVKASEIISLDVDLIALQTVIDRFGAHRLLLFDRDKVTGSPTVEVGHEALLSEWPRLEAWITRARRDLLRHAALRAAVDEWERADRDPGYLLTGTRLAETEASSASGAVQMNAQELEYLDASVAVRAAHEESEHERQASEARLAGSARRRLWGLVAVVGALVAVVAVVLLVRPGAKPQVAFIEAATISGDLAGAGLEDAARQFGVTFERITPPWPSVEARQRSLAEAGVDLIIVEVGVDRGAAQFLALEFPDTKFAVIQGIAFPPVPPNYVAYRFDDSQSSYLAGIAAAMESKTGKVGMIAAYEVDFVIDRVAGFLDGATSVDPDLDVEVVYLEDAPQDAPPGEDAEFFNRPDLAREIALDLYRQGVDVIAHSAGDSGLGIFQAARETTDDTGIHVWGIGANSDQFFDVPVDQQGHVLMSTVRRYDAAVLDAVEMVATDTFNSGNRIVKSDDGIDYVTTGNHLRSATVAALETAKESIRSGDIDVAGHELIPETVASCGTDETGYGLVAGCRILTVAFDPFPRPPHLDYSSDDTRIGFEVDLLNELAKRLGLEVNRVEVAFPDLIAGISEGVWDIALSRLDITPERTERVDFSLPYLHNPIVIFANSSSEITRLEDVRTVAVQEGSSMEELLRSQFPQFELIPSASFGPAAMLDQGEVDALATNLDAEDLTDENLRLLATIAEFHTAMPVNPAATGLVEAVNDALTAMFEDGTYAEIYERWFDNQRERADN